MKSHVTELLNSALSVLKQRDGLIIDSPAIQLEATKDKNHGDLASNIALVLAKPNRINPKELAKTIVAAIPTSPEVVKIEIAGPGFINFFLAPSSLYSVLKTIFQAGEQYGESDIGKGQKIILEFVSSNPTGPLHVGHGRHASFGMVLSELLKKIGFEVHREYYVNDAGRQMDILATSVWLRYLAFFSDIFPFPANGYQGDYVIDIAKALQKKYDQDFLVDITALSENLPLDEPAGGDKEIYIDAVIERAKKLLQKKYLTVSQFSLNAILQDMKEDLADFGVHFDKWFSEREFVETDAVDRMIASLKKNELAYERDQALWFRSTNFNDNKDRVLQRSNGQRTYFANDLAYHLNKFERGFSSVINIFGSDHHGYVPRMQAGVKAFNFDLARLIYLTLQFVTLYRGDQLVPMSTRSGSFIPLRELRQEVGNDAARFFYVMRRSDQPIDFDLELAKSKSNENPVYYIQYAHARICSVMRQLEEKGLKYDQKLGLDHESLLTEPQEFQLLSTLARYPEVILNAAKQYEPALLTTYLRQLATDFHAYYNAQQFLVEDPNLRNARLSLVQATRQVLVNGLKLIGVSIPESM